MRKILIAAVASLVLLGVLKHHGRAPVHPGPGVLAPAAPEQVDLDHGAQLQKGDTTLTTRAHFDITARVLEMFGRLGLRTREPLFTKALDFVWKEQAEDHCW